MATATSLAEIECTIAEAAVLTETLTDKNDSVMLWGGPGLGKSAIVHQLGGKRKRRVIDYRANLREPVDVRGIPVPDLGSGVTRWLVPDELPNAKRDGPEGYLFLDEINTSSPQMQAALFQLVLDKKVGDYSLPPGWQVIAAGNRVSDRAAAQRMPTALRNRFAHLFVLPDVDAWAAWANANGVAPEMVAFVRLRRELIHRMPRGDENCFPTPRSLTAAAKYVSVENVAMRQKLFAAHIGADVAGELNGFIELYQSLGSLEDIVASPKTARVPTQASQLYAVATGLGRLADRKNFPAIMTYCERLDAERQMLLVHDATVREPKLKETAAYSAWAVKHQDLLMQS
jgi:dynein-related subfamily AAA family protein